MKCPRKRVNSNQAVVRWLKEKSHKATIATDRSHFQWLDRFLRDVPLELIDRNLVDRITEARSAEGVSNATVNRMLEVLRAVLRISEIEWKWLDRAPRVQLLKEPKRRV